MKDGIKELDSDFAKEVGFTSDKFDGWLWRQHGYIIISFITSKQKRQGNFNGVLDAIWKKGYWVKVPTPSVTMKTILIKKGFKETEEYDKRGSAVEVWYKRK